MKSASPCVLTINGGSSSIRFAVYESGETLRRRLAGKIDRIGLSGTNLTLTGSAEKPPRSRRLAAGHRTAAGFLMDWLEAQPVFASDPLVFSGGIGENAPRLGADICAGLDFLGVLVDRKRNGRNAPLVSPVASGVVVRVVGTDEECMIAKEVCATLRGKVSLHGPSETQPDAKAGRLVFA